MLKLNIRLIVLFFLSCGGQVPKGTEIEPGLEGAPDWVKRGSRVEEGRIYGVGSVNGVKNPALARDAAANRGRAEISRILETYSASLLKDYQASLTAGAFQASDEAQSAEQVIKTFSANLMNGTETKEIWPHASEDVWFALVELDFARAKEVAAVQAQMSPGLRGWLDQNGDRVLQDLERGLGNIATNNGAQPGPETSASALETPARVGGPKPQWTQGACDRSLYLCGVGDGVDRQAADIDARAELARIFAVNIKTVANSFEGAYRKIRDATGEQWHEVQSVSQHSIVSSDRMVPMSEILDRWQSDDGEHWALAVIERAKASRALREDIQSKDQQMTTYLSQARTEEDKLKRLRDVRQAVALMAEREAMNSDLRVIVGQGIPAPHTLAELTNLLDGAQESLSVGLVLSGEGADRVRDCLVEALSARKYQLKAQIDTDDAVNGLRGDFDAEIRGRVHSESFGKVAGGEVVQTRLTLELVNHRTGKSLRTLTGLAKGTRVSLSAAAATSAYKICQSKVPEMVAVLDQYFQQK